MKNTPSLIEVKAKFGTTQQCIEFIEKMRWPNGVRCLVCGCEKVSKFVSNETTRKRKNRKGVVKAVRVPARYLYTCLEPTCGFQFSPTAGTVLHDTHLPLETWFTAVALMCNAKKGLSAKQMQRDLGVSYPTAWYLCHRIRKAMEDGDPGRIFMGTVEGDETYVGGRYDRRRKRGPYEKQAVIGFLERSREYAGRTRCSQVRAFPIPTNSATILSSAVTKDVAINADIFITDQNPGYTTIGRFFNHQTVNHISLEYVRKGDPKIHTNSIENFWSLFKRGLIGSYHQVSIKHLRRYLDEFTFRFNNREAEDLFGLVMVNLLITSGIKYSELTAKAEPSEEPFSALVCAVSRRVVSAQLRAASALRPQKTPCPPSRRAVRGVLASRLQS